MQKKNRPGLGLRREREILGSRERLHRYALWLVRCGRDLVAEDEAKAVADLAMVKAWRRFGTSKCPSFYPYARHWVRGAILNHVGGILARQEVEDVRPEPMDREAPGDLEEEVCRRVRLEALLRGLTPESRTLVMAHAVGEVSLAALAREQGRHRAWACRRYQRALGHLRTGGRLAGWPGPDDPPRGGAG